MENLGDVLKRLGTTRSVLKGELPASLITNSNSGVDDCEVCQGRGWFTPDVPMGHAEFGKVSTCQCRRDQLDKEQSSRLLRYSNLGHLTRFTFQTLDSSGHSKNVDDSHMFNKAYDIAIEYAELPQGWLVITGPHGSGKTHLAAAIANRCIETGKPVFFVHIPDLLDHLRAGFAPTGDSSYSDLFEQVINTPLLILDGLGTQISTPWAQEKLQQIFNHRYNAELPTIITVAKSLEEIDVYIRSRVESPGLTRILALQAKDSNLVHEQGRVNHELLKRMQFETFAVAGNRPNASQRASLEGGFQAAKNFADDPHGWLTFFGETGVGKTHLAVAIAAVRVQKNAPVWFAFVPELLDYLRYTFTPDSQVTYDRVFDEIKNSELLILDDLGREHSSPWAQEKLYQIIVHRHNSRLPTVITSTLDFAEQTGPISSRIRDPYVGQLIRIDAPDYRIKERRNSNASGR